MRKIFARRAVAAALLAGAFSCAPRSSSRPVLAPGPAFPLIEDARIDFEGDLSGPPLPLGGDIALATPSGVIFLANPAEKKIVRRLAAKAPLASPVLAGSGFLIVFDQGGRITRWSGDGKAGWEKAVPGSVSSAALTSGSILAAFDRRTLRCFDPATGSEKWSWTADEDIVAGPRPWGGKTVLLTAGMKTVLLSMDGRPGPEFKTAAAASGPLLVSDGRMFAGFAGGTVQCWDLGSGKRRWTVKTGAALAADPVAEGNRIFFVTESRQLFAVEARSGSVRWWESLPGRAVGGPVVCGSRLLAPALSSVLTAFDAATGKKSETNDLKQNAIAAPLVLGDRVAVAVRDPATLRGSLVVLKGKPPSPPPAPEKK